MALKFWVPLKINYKMHVNFYKDVDNLDFEHKT